MNVKTLAALMEKNMHIKVEGAQKSLLQKIKRLWNTLTALREKENE